LVAKASGGAATEPKLIAAREADLPVVLLRRPRAEPGPRVQDIPAALDWIDRHFRPRTEPAIEVLQP